MPTYSVDLSDYAGASASVRVALPVGVSDASKSADALVYQRITKFSVSDHATSSSTLSYLYQPGGGISDVAKATDAVQVTTTFHISVSDSVHALDRLGGASNVTVSDSAASGSSAHAAWVMNLISVARAVDGVSVWMTWNTHILDGARAAESLLDPAKGLTASDSAQSSSSASVNYIAGMAISDSARAVETFTAKRLVLPVIPDMAGTSDLAYPNFVYGLSVSDAAWAHEFADMGGSITAWAINTRTNAVSQYRDFAFNSFASMGRTYIAADETGVYELVGPEDDGVPVIGDFAGGFFQPSDGKLAGFKGVYMGVQGQGTWRLTLTAGDGQDYIYQRLSAPNLMTTKFDIGKGLRSRYFAWRLTAVDGQDFDFDTLDLVPAMSGRRIG